MHLRKHKENQTHPYGLHASFLPLVGLPLAIPLPEKLKRKRSSGSVECAYQSNDPEGYTYQSFDSEGYTYQSRNPKRHHAFAFQATTQINDVYTTYTREIPPIVLTKTHRDSAQIERLTLHDESEDWLRKMAWHLQKRRSAIIGARRRNDRAKDGGSHTAAMEMPLETLTVSDLRLKEEEKNSWTVAMFQTRHRAKERQGELGSGLARSQRPRSAEAVDRKRTKDVRLLKLNGKEEGRGSEMVVAVNSVCRR
ncbi:NBS-LRR type resistance protein [Cucumis melo var. makuwa]|uniref:NBS-LRR type resistance protein n=1 Tax=Cucumis melo var. makuwa TaxID=1194695 RepID=A0A5A7UNP7_CUCMM|nr:NBS-LRR type resistance protein [Cucumis melo var. makuwa]TYK21182.1 NBS-LRR type resistance protein [Cucumis melo var. makuwa]